MAREDLRVTFVAVTVTDALAVAVVVELVRRYETIAVVVVTVADLRSAWVGLVVVVVAVALADHPTVGVIVVLAWWQIAVAVGVATVADFFRAQIGGGVLLVAVVIVGDITRRLAALAGSSTRSSAAVAVVVAPVHVAVPAAVAVVAVQAAVATSLRSASPLLTARVHPVFQELKLICVEAVGVGTIVRTNRLTIEYWITGAAFAGRHGAVQDSVQHALVHGLATTRSPLLSLRPGGGEAIAGSAGVGVASAALPFKDLLFHRFVGWAPVGGEAWARVSDTRPEAVAVVVVVYVADFIRPAVAVLVDVVTPTWALGLRNLDALQPKGAAIAGEVEVTVLVVEA